MALRHPYLAIMTGQDKRHPAELPARSRTGPGHDIEYLRILRLYPIIRPDVDHRPSPVT